MAKCLIVDDSDVTLYVTRNIMETLNYEVKTAKTINEASSELADETINLIITDILLCNEHASELIKVIKQGKHKNTPIIALTGVDCNDQQTEITELGVDDYLLKPTTLEKLHVSLDKLGLK